MRDGARARTPRRWRCTACSTSCSPRHPTVEFESCASGGGRIDHEILQRTERVWTSDCNDALERQTIQRGTSMFIPPELMGAHIGPTRSHTTGGRTRCRSGPRRRCSVTSGVEWDVTELSDRERIALRAVIAMHKEHRRLLHSGDTVRFDTDPAYSAHGVYAPDRSRGHRVVRPARRRRRARHLRRCGCRGSTPTPAIESSTCPSRTSVGVPDVRSRRGSPTVSH